MPPSAFLYEVCLLHANYIRREAKRLVAKTESTEAARALRNERVAMRASKDWLDRLVIEHLDLDQRATQ